jgi:hypothetical protein
LLEKHGITIDKARPAQHSRRTAELDTEQFPVIAADLLAYITVLDEVADDVRVVWDEPAGPCTSCQMDDAVADVRVYDGPVLDEMCRDCAPHAIRVANSDAVVVEVLAR